MKKTFSIVALGLLATFINPVQAQIWPVFKGQSFLNAQVVRATNSINITNLAYPGVVGTNMVGTIYTNLAGTRVVTTATSSTTNFNLLQPVPLLWSRESGAPAYTVTSTNGLTTQPNAPGDANISYSIVGGSGANSAVLFVFAPTWDGVNVDTSGNFDFVFSVTATTTTRINGATNAPLSRWIGARGVVCKSIGTADTDANGHVEVSALQLNGFGPP